MKRSAIVLLALFLLAAACASDTDQSDQSTDTAIADSSEVTPVSLNVPRVSSSPDAESLAAIRSADAQFGLDLFQVVATDDNLMFSPYSIATALSMLSAGAEGQTAAEIAEVMHLPDGVDLHAVRNHIDQLLATEPVKTPDDAADPFVIRPANSVWGQANYPFSNDYLTVLAENYGAGLQTVDFGSNPDGSRELINDWVEDATEDRVKDLLPDGSIDEATRLVLVNAIWFKASWAEPFLPENTTDGEFTLLDGSKVTVPLMQAGASQYAEASNYKALRLPYAGDASMVILLPKDGMPPAELASRMTADDMAIDWGHYSVRATLPKFNFETEIDLPDALEALGMLEAFDAGSANLDAITDTPNDLYVSGAFHKSFIGVDEQGTEAAAATGFSMSATSAPPPAEFKANRPFLFWIEHNQAGVLFIGQVTNPS